MGSTPRREDDLSFQIVEGCQVYKHTSLCRGSDSPDFLQAWLYVFFQTLSNLWEYDAQMVRSSIRKKAACQSMLDPQR
jgi:hypothetical protein